MTFEVLGLSGKMGTGKDYLFGNHLRRQGYYRVALADHFKIAAIGRGLATREEVFYTKPPHVRDALQKTGTEEGRDVYGKDVWCNHAFAWMEHWAVTWGITRFCLVDVRFQNEVEFVRRHGGKVIRLVAPSRAAEHASEDVAKLHQSEVDLDDYADFDLYAVNEPNERPLHDQVASGFRGDFTAAQIEGFRGLERAMVAKCRAREEERQRQFRKDQRAKLKDLEQQKAEIESTLFTDPYRRERGERRAA